MALRSSAALMGPAATPETTASTRAENELKELRKKADKQTAEKTAALDAEILSEAESLRKAAEGKLEKAAALVVERITGT